MVTLFLGAGASTAVGLPTGNELRNQALDAITGTVVDDGTFVSVANGWFSQLQARSALSDAELAAGPKAFVGELTLERVLQQEQFDENQTNSATLRRFAVMHKNAMDALRAELAGRSDALQLITAARQRLVLETRCGDQVRAFVTEADMAQFPDYLSEYLTVGGRVPLLKLHGDISVPETIVANLEQTTAGLSVSRDAALSAVIDQMDNMPTRPWWYVGYSMRDRDLDRAWTTPRMASFNEHWVSPFLDDTVEEFMNQRRRMRWQEARRPQQPLERLISLTAEEFYDAFLKIVVATW
jgi:hypothetical protein